MLTILYHLSFSSSKSATCHSRCAAGGAWPGDPGALRAASHGAGADLAPLWSRRRPRLEPVLMRNDAHGPAEARRATAGGHATRASAGRAAPEALKATGQLFRATPARKRGLRRANFIIFHQNYSKFFIFEYISSGSQHSTAFHELLKELNRLEPSLRATHGTQDDSQATPREHFSNGAVPASATGAGAREER